MAWSDAARAAAAEMRRRKAAGQPWRLRSGRYPAGNRWTETNSQEKLRLKKSIALAVKRNDLHRAEAFRLDARKLKGEIQLRRLAKRK